MILVDTSVWIDHLRRTDTHLRSQLDAGVILCHPFVITELALGNLRQRDKVLAALRGLPTATLVTEAIVLYEKPLSMTLFVTPAKAGVWGRRHTVRAALLDSRFRGNDDERVDLAGRWY